MVPPVSGPLRDRAQGRAQGSEDGTRNQGGVYQKENGGVYHTPIHFSAGFVRVFRPGPDDPNRASGEGRDGSDPPFSTAGAVRREGGCTTRCTTGCPIPPAFVGVAPVSMYPCWKAPPPARGQDDETHRAKR